MKGEIKAPSRAGSVTSKTTQKTVVSSAVKIKNVVKIRGYRAYKSELTWKWKKHATVTDHLIALLSQVSGFCGLRCTFQ